MINYAKNKAAEKTKTAIEAALDAKNAHETDGEAIRALIPGAAKKNTPSSDTSASGDALAATRRFLTRLEFCAELRISETTYHALALRGVVKPVKIGRRTLIPASEVDAVIERLNGSHATTDEAPR